ncbi:hypothetical protein [Nostoc sp.]
MRCLLCETLRERRAQPSLTYPSPPITAIALHTVSAIADQSHLATLPDLANL